MIDKIATVHWSKLGQRIGKVSTTEMLRLERGLLVYLGMTGDHHRVRCSRAIALKTLGGYATRAKF